MPVNSQHPSFHAALPKWKRCRDCYDGSDAVKEAGTDYLAKPGGQDAKEYRAYVDRALFLEAFARTVEGFVGSIARKDPKVDAPDAFEFIVDDITGTGIGLLEFIKTLDGELFITGRVGVLVDFDVESARPYATYYRAEQIINWFPDGSIMLEEHVFKPDPADPFKTITVTQWRHLGFLDGVYNVTVWRKKNNTAIGGDGFYIHEQSQPDIRGMKLAKIPFFFLSRHGAASTIEKPPLLGLADVALSHYRTSADLEHGRHFTALPTLYVCGVSGSDKDIRIGGSAAIVLSEANAKVGYAEFSGAGLSSLETGLEQKETQMAVLGASLFTGSKGGIEATETARIRVNGENSLLSSVVSATEEVMESVLQIMADWLHLNYEIELSINRDFIGERIDAATIQALVKAYISGAITLEVFLHNLEEGEALPPGASVEDIAEQIRAEQEASAKQAEEAAAKVAAQAASDKSKPPVAAKSKPPLDK